MSWSAQFEKGWVPAAATRIPWRWASAMISPRSSWTSRRTSEMSLQMPVPISMTDWCISGLTRSFRSLFPSSRSSWTCERSSRVSGSMIWNSSSTPRVKAGRSTDTGRPLLGSRLCRHRSASPGAGGAAGLLRLVGVDGRRRDRLPRPLPLPGAGRARSLEDPLDQPSRGLVHDPLEVVSPDRGDVRVRRGVQEVDRVRDPVADRELDRVELVPERPGQLQAVAAEPLLESRVDRRRALDVAVGMRLPRVVAHDPDVLGPEDVAAEVLLEDDLLLERHHVLAR